jgi:uncharacterized membrane protein
VEPTEAWIHGAVQWLRLVVETTGAMIVALGFFVAAVRFISSLVTDQTGNFTPIRLLLARYLALALEFQLGADILSTAIAPSWTQIGKLGAIAVIRTGLNFFLSKEMETERAAVKGEERVERDSLPQRAA